MQIGSVMRKVLSLFLLLAILGSMIPPFSHAETNNPGKRSNPDSEEILSSITGIIKWKKVSIGVGASDPLLNNRFLESAGDTSGDWYPIGIGRIGYPDDYAAYLAVIGDNVSRRYQSKAMLSISKATEWHRIALAILAMGGDPTQIGKAPDGTPINLIADGTYNRGKTRSLGTQGLNGWIWGLITLDSMRYKVPKDAYSNRNEVIVEILQQQLADGGFSLNQDKADPDMTAMAVQALAPYYNSEQTYKYEQKPKKVKVTKTVRQVVDEALGTLSKLQLSDGDFESWGAENVESTAQVVVALTSLGIDPQKDERFIKEGHTTINGILKYRMEDGGFIHSQTYTQENPTAKPDKSNTMASEQVLYALTSYFRFIENKRSLYDFRAEMDKALKEKIESIKTAIYHLPDSVTEKDREAVQRIFNEYMQIPIPERSYVFNYHILANKLVALGIKNTSEPLAENIGVTDHGNGTVTRLFDKQNHENQETLFSEEDAVKARKIPENVTTANYVEVVKLIEKLEKASNRSSFKDLLTDLNNKKKAIDEINREIESINSDILDQLYPFSDLSIKDKKKVDAILARFEKLSKYDQQKIPSYDDVIKSKAKIDSMIRARIIAAIIIVFVIIITVSVGRRMRKRKKEMMKQKMQLADEEEGDEEE